GIDGVSQSPLPGTLLNPGVHTVTISADDMSGNTSSCDFQVTITDESVPEVTCPANETVEVTDASCTYTTPDLVSLFGVQAAACSSVTLSSNVLTGVGLPVGDHIITFTATGSNGNTDECVTTLTVADVTTPILLCPISIDVEANSSCEVVVPDLFDEALVSASDNCNFSVVQSIAPGTNLNTSTSVLVSATDASNNEETCSVQLVPVLPNPLSIGCPISLNQVSLDDNCELALADYTSLVAVTTPCNVGYTLTQIPAPWTLMTSTGIQEITFVLEDDLGNSTSCSVDLSVRDFNNPVQITPSNQTIVLEDGECAFTLESWSQIIEFDDCTDISFWSGTSIGDSFGAGTHLINGQVLDDFGQPANFSINLEVVDTTSPTIDCQAETVQIQTNADCSWSWPDWEDYFTYFDPCGATVSIAAPVESSPGQYTVFVEVSDLYHAVSCEIQAVLVDNIAPVILDCPEDQTLEMEMSCQAQLPDYTVSLNATDNCTDPDDLQVTQTPAAGTWIEQTTTVILSVVDESGQEASCNFEVMLSDTEAPQIQTCANDFVIQYTNCDAFMPDVTGEVTATDNCSWNVSQSISVGSALDIGIHDLEIQVVDAQNNTSTCNVQVNVVDAASPILSVIAMANYITNSGCNYQVDAIESYVDITDCSVFVASMEPEEGGLLPVGIHDFIVNVEDEHGNPSMVEFTIEVEGTSILDITNCPMDQQVQLNEDCEFELPNFLTSLLASGACGEDVVWTQTPAPGTLYDEATNVEVIIEATITGQIDQCSFMVTIGDEADPILSCEDIELVLTDCEAAMPDLSTLGWAMDCSELNYQQSILAGELLSVGSPEVIFTATDVYSNSNDCAIQVTVVDNSMPTVDCSSLSANPIEINCDFTVPDWTGEIDVTDNCSSEIQITQNSIGEVWQDGIHEVEFFVSDGTNSTTCAVNVELVNVNIPTLTCPANIAVDMGGDNTCTVAIAYDTPTIQNGCGTYQVVLVEGLASGESFPTGTTTVTYTIQGVDHPDATCSFEVTVQDLIDPTIECPEPIVTCNPAVIFDLPTYSDNCDQVVLEQFDNYGLVPGDTFPLGETILQYKAVDASGNWVSCGLSITVLDPEPAAWAALESTYCANDPDVDLNALIEVNETTFWSPIVDSGVLSPSLLGAGTYDITLNSTDECVSDSTQTITIVDFPTLNWLAEPAYCGLTNIIEVETNASLIWDLPDGVSTQDDLQSNVIEIQAEKSSNFLFTVNLINDAGCESSSTISILFEDSELGVDAGEDEVWAINEGSLMGSYTGEAQVEWSTDGQAIINQP
ncbi:MAG: HYR domain-containing protein, partial [Bacteroidota bacterium]